LIPEPRRRWSGSASRQVTWSSLSWISSATLPVFEAPLVRTLILSPRVEELIQVGPRFEVAGSDQGENLFAILRRLEEPKGLGNPEVLEYAFRRVLGGLCLGEGDRLGITAGHPQREALLVVKTAVVTGPIFVYDTKDASN